MAPAMTIAENLFLGREMRRDGFLGNVLRMLDKKKMLEIAVQRMADLEGGHPLDDAGRRGRSRRPAPVRRSGRAAAFARHVVIPTNRPRRSA